MNSFTKNGLIQKIIIAIIFIILFNCIYPCIPVYADESGTGETQEAPGGVLFQPLMNLISGLGEGIVWLLQSQLLGMSTSNIFVTNDGDVIGSIIAALGTAAAAAGVVALMFVPGVNVAVAGAVIAGGAGVCVAGNVVADQFPDEFFLPIYKISPQEIFSNQIPALDVNFINPTVKNEEGKLDGNVAYILSPYIARWYVAIRNLVLVGLMVVLLYIGIRIVITTTAGEKAKYKEHLKDWLIAVILVVFMHYMMSFALTATGYIIGILNTQNEIIGVPVPEESIQDIADAVGVDKSSLQADDGNYYYFTNLMGYARLMQQLDNRDDTGNQQFNWSYIGWTIMFMILVIFTCMFLVIYLKRVVYMAFLTVIAPLVALTYPIDKINDGQAQAFNIWLKEYIYNLLLQPFHLLLYTLLVGSAMDIAKENMLYAIVALGFLVPAEQLLRKMFGFDQKAPEAGSMVGSIVGGSMAMSAINSMRRIGSVSKRENGNGNKALASEGNNSKTRLTELKRGADSDRKASIGQLYGNTGAINTQSAGNNGGTLGFASTRNSSSASGNRFNASEPLEIASSLRDKAKGKIDMAKDRASNSKPVRFVNARRSDFNNWLGKTPKTKLGRDAKKILIRGVRGAGKGAKTLGKNAFAAGGTALHYTGKGLAAVGKKAPRVLSKVGLGVAVGTAGVAAGLSTGDWSNALQYGATAAGVGTSVAEGAANITANIGRGSVDTAKGIRDEYERRRYTKEEREDKENERADKEWRRSKEIKRMYQDEFGKEKDEDGVEKWKKAMDMSLELRKYGATDDKTNMKVISDVGVGNQLSGEDVAIAKAAPVVKTEKDLDGLAKRLEEENVPEHKIKEAKRRIRKINFDY